MQRRTRIETMAPIAKGRTHEVDNSPDLNAIQGNATAATKFHQDYPGQPQENTFDAVLYPNRSLSNKGFIVVMGIVIGVNFLSALYFTLLGAWPVLVFGGLDIFVVWLAFKLNYRQGRLQERVRVQKGAITVSRILPSGHEMRWRLHPLWTDIKVDPLKTNTQTDEHGFDNNIAIHQITDHDNQVTLRSKGETLVLGAFLSPEERVGFGKALEKAINHARTASF